MLDIALLSDLDSRAPSHLRSPSHKRACRNILQALVGFAPPCLRV
jgi:hypothetical protein